MALTQVTTDGIANAAITQEKISETVSLGGGSGSGGPKITAIQITDDAYNTLDDTAVSLAGGFIKILGSGFIEGCQVLVGLTPATSVTFISDTEVRAQVPATTAGTYIIYLVNTDGGTAIRVNAVNFSGIPTWTGESLLEGISDSAISVQLTATGAASYVVAPGSTLPPGVTLSESGLLSGTIIGLETETIYNFVINAVDDELQDSPKTFSLTVSVASPIGQQAYTTPGTYSWTAPAAVTTVSVVAVGAGGAGADGNGGAGGGLGWKNNITVTPGQSYTVVVGLGGPANTAGAGGAGGDSYFINDTTVKGGGGGGGQPNTVAPGVQSGQFVGDGGSQGGLGGYGGGVYGSTAWAGGGGGAGGYAVRAEYPVYGSSYTPRSTGSGAGGVSAAGFDGENGGGGGGGADWHSQGASIGGDGGGVGILGQGSNGIGGSYGQSGAGTDSIYGGAGGAGSGGIEKSYGGGGGGLGNYNGKAGGNGAVRIIWGDDRAFPATNTGDL